MSKLNEDVIFLILKELQNDPSSLYSCLLINRTWCEMTEQNHLLFQDLKIAFSELEYFCCHSDTSVNHIPSNILSSLQKGTTLKSSIINHYIFDEGKIIRAIYQNCPNLKFLEISLINENISEFENLLINCQYLNSLEVASKYEFNG
ncbi:hypothetical protein C1646_771652 [Rhizophagus diaphanus]|nr:hypothetical protein C1646_771652 [Rhizophagus diaphanus] [Rhizophagus sp. MUCL 43196]